MGNALVKECGGRGSLLLFVCRCIATHDTTRSDGGCSQRPLALMVCVLRERKEDIVEL